MFKNQKKNAKYLNFCKTSNARKTCKTLSSLQEIPKNTVLTDVIFELYQLEMRNNISKNVIFFKLEKAK